MDGDLIQGTLQSLMQNRQQLAGQQQQAQQQHLQTMQTPLPQTSPIQSMVSDYLTKYAANPTMSWSAAAAAVGGQPERERVGLTSQLARQEAADAQAAKYAGENLKEADLFGSKLTAATRAGKGAGVTVKMDKDGNMVVYDPATQESRVVHASQRGEYQRIWSKAYEKAVQEDMENPEGYAANVASKVLSISPGFNPQKQPLQGGLQPAEEVKPKAESGIPKFEPLPEIPGLTPFDPNKVGLQVPAGQGSPDINKLSPVEQQMAAALKAGTGMAQNPATAQAGTQMLQGLQSQFPRPEQGLIKPQAAPSLPPTQQPQAAPTVGALPPQVAPGAAANIQYKDIPKEAAAKRGAEDMASSYVKDYETVQNEAASAANQKSVFDMLQKERPKTGLFADAEKVVGGLFSALGQDPNSPTIQNAMKTRNAEQLLSQLTNASLKAEKGVQTKTDEVRIYKEFPKTTDFQKVWDFSIKLGQERAQRKLEQRDFYDQVANENRGTPVGARRKWDQEMSNDPITQYLGGKLIFRSDFLRAYEAKYPDLGRDGAIAKWREMEQEYQKRGGRK